MPSPDIDNQINPDKIEFFELVDEFIIPHIEVFVKDDKNITKTIGLRVDATVLELMEKVAEKTGVHPWEQILWFAGKQLEPHHHINFYNVQQESTIHLTGPVEGGKGELPAVEAFIYAQIVHGNVTGLITEESNLALEYIRRPDQQTRDEYVQIQRTLRFRPEYNDPALNALCFKALLVEGFHGGNCQEMAEWTAVKLIETTTNQWVYICGFKGTFTLKPTIDVNDKSHVLWDEKAGKVSNKFDHATVITYPTEVASIDDMDAEKATVIDTWYNNLVCSLKAGLLSSKKRLYCKEKRCRKI